MRLWRQTQYLSLQLGLGWVYGDTLNNAVLAVVAGAEIPVCLAQVLQENISRNPSATMQGKAGECHGPVATATAKNVHANAATTGLERLKNTSP